jgi:hypothetical protein
LTKKEMSKVIGGFVGCLEEDELGCTYCLEWNGLFYDVYWCCDFGDAGGGVCV